MHKCYCKRYVTHFLLFNQSKVRLQVKSIYFKTKAHKNNEKDNLIISALLSISANFDIFYNLTFEKVEANYSHTLNNILNEVSYSWKSMLTYQSMYDYLLIQMWVLVQASLVNAMERVFEVEWLKITLATVTLDSRELIVNWVNKIIWFLIHI